MLLRHSFGRDDAATGIENAAEVALHSGLRTADIAPACGPACTAIEFTEAVLDHMSE